MTDPEVLAQHRREAEARKAAVRRHQITSGIVKDHLFALAERNHFGPDIEAAFHVGRKK